MPETVTESVSKDQGEVENRARTKLFGDLSGIQVAGGALAAVTSALAASRLGVAGTLIGAGVGSVVASVAGTLYSNSIRIHAEKLAGLRRGRTIDAAAGMVSAGVDPASSPVRGPGRRRWGRILAPIALVALLGIGVVTSIEAVLGHPLGDSTGAGTSVSAVVRDSGRSSGSGSDGSGVGSPASADPSSTTDQDGTEPSETSSSVPAVEPTAEPSSGSSTTPSAAPSEEPATSSPAESSPDPSVSAPAESSGSTDPAPEDSTTRAPQVSGSDPQ